MSKPLHTASNSSTSLFIKSTVSLVFIHKNKLPDIILVDGEEYYGKTYQDSEKRIPNIDKMRSVGWEPGYNLAETFELSMDYYIQKRLRKEL